MEISDSVIAGGIITGIAGFFGWVFKLVARQAVDQFNAGLQMHAKALDNMGSKVDRLIDQVQSDQIMAAAFNERLKRLEEKVK